MLENSFQHSHCKWLCCTDLSTFIAHFEGGPKELAIDDLLGMLKSGILFYSLRVVFQGESVNTSRVSVLVSLSGSGECVTHLQYLMLVGCDLVSLIDKSLRTHFVLIRN